VAARHRALRVLLLVGIAALSLGAGRGPRVDLNSAPRDELVALPGVGEATADKIMAGRPYASVSDLARAGVSAKTIDQIKALVTVRHARAADRPPAKAAPRERPTASAPSAPPSAPSSAPAPRAGRVDLNTATPRELEDLPGVGSVTAQKIIAGRPYASVEDLARAGVSARVIAQLQPMVTVGRQSGSRPPVTSAPATSPSAAPEAPPTSPPAIRPPRATPPAAAPPRPTATNPPPDATAPAPAPAQPGMVWVNTDTKVFHRAGDRWYGHTKKGQYMTEADALAAGYRESRAHVGEKPLVWVNLDTRVFHRPGDTWYGKTAHGEYMTEEDAVRAGYREARPDVKEK